MPWIFIGNNDEKYGNVVKSIEIKMSRHAGHFYFQLS